MLNDFFSSRFTDSRKTTDIFNVKLQRLKETCLPITGESVKAKSRSNVRQLSFLDIYDEYDLETANQNDMVCEDIGIGYSTKNSGHEPSGASVSNCI